jgi:hypothetical protein
MAVGLSASAVAIGAGIYRVPSPVFNDQYSTTNTSFIEVKIMATTTFLLNEFTGTDAQVQVTLTDQGTDTVRVTLDGVSDITGNIADLVGFFANFKSSFMLTEALNIALVSEMPGDLISTSESTNGSGILFLDDSGSTTDGITDVSSNVNLNGAGEQRTFDIGVQFGSGGLGQGDDFRSVSFDLSAAGLDISDFASVGVRLQSVGPVGDRSGSSKLEGEVPSFQPFSIAGTKYLDQTGNGIGEGDTGLGGITIFIDKDGNGTLSSGDLTTTTAADGTWIFNNLGADFLNKQVFEALPGSYVQTVGNAGYTLPSAGGQNLTGLDFANFKLFSLAGTKYLDKTGNGLSDDDTGLGGVTIFIDVDGNGAFNTGDRSTVTAADGRWSFGDLSYDLLDKRVFEALPDGYVQTAGNDGYALPSIGGQDLSGLNFANFKLFNISGTKYLDKTGNGVSGDDTGLGGITIFIDKDGDGAFNSTTDLSTVTAADGSWSFTNLSFDVLGKRVLELVPGGYLQTVGSAGYLLPSEGGQDQTGLNFANFKPTGPGVGTPGYWGNRNGTTAWNTLTSQSANFVDDPVVAGTSKVAGAILIGDFNRNGITDAGENTIFYTNAEARVILSASTTNDDQDARYILGRQLVASWMNVLAGNTYDTVFASVKQDIDNGVVWLKNATPNEGGDAAGDGNLTIAGSTLPSSNARWSSALNNPANGAGRHYGAWVKDVLDYYNNTGAGFAIDRDTGLVGGSLSKLSGFQAYRPHFY